jgi:hypothetical protein
MIIAPDGTICEAISDGVQIPKEIFNEAIKDTVLDETGYSKTIGSYLSEHFGFNGGDWFRNVTDTDFDRKKQILTSLSRYSNWF